jgi:Fic family protein
VQSWIGGGVTPRLAQFIPPPPDDVPDLLDDLVSFTNRDDLSAITQAAIAHVQFETIHPFADGNGRVGRCLIHVILRRRGLSRRVMPPISVALAANTGRYIAVDKLPIGEPR